MERKNSYILRINELETLNMIEDLEKTGLYKSKNLLLNKCIDVGIRQIYMDVFGKKVGKIKELEKNNEIDGRLERLIRQIKVTGDDVFVMLNILEFMITTLFNTKIAEMLNIPIDSDMLRDGELAELPDNLKIIKQEIVKMLEEKERNE